MRYYLQLAPVNKYKKGHIWLYTPARETALNINYVSILSPVVNYEDIVDTNYVIFGNHLYNLVNVNDNLPGWELRYFHKHKNNLTKFLPLTKAEAESDLFYKVSLKAISMPRN